MVMTMCKNQQWNEITHYNNW